MAGFHNKRRALLLFVDILCFLVCFTVAEFIAYIFKIPFSLSHYLICAAVFFVLIFGLRFATRVYDHVWRYANSRTYLTMVVADAAAGLTAVGVLQLLDVNPSFWFSLCQAFGVAASCDILTLVARFVYQTFFGEKHPLNTENNKIGVAIVGAGQTGVLLAQELLAGAHSHYRPICFVDVDNDKIGNRVLGLRVYGEEEIRQKLKVLPVQEIFIALPSVSAAEARRLHDFYSASGCKIKLYDFPMNDMNESVKTGKKVIREIRIEDLLFRESVAVADDKTKAFYAGRVVMVTGCGSIGSELCRQIAACDPMQLILVDIYENNAYDIQQELVRTYGSALNLAVEIASVRDRVRMEAIFAAYRPEIVFHAAAHKHVPLMEHSCCEAVKNNVYGTLNTVELAEKYQVDKFIMISTDKAVNPTNVMGATKRLCEMIVQSRYDSKTTFAAVRFGNVLGSNGSVIPLFRAQIAAGGPVTITDKRIIRYFMTIPEASQLVMQTGAMAKSGELFVLNMGNPVKILTLAENLISLSGYRPYVDIDIQEIGLRPGEKLFEELLIRDEAMTKTSNDRIFIEKDTPLSREEVAKKLKILAEALAQASDTLSQDAVIAALKTVVPTFVDPETVNTSQEAEKELSKQTG